MKLEPRDAERALAAPPPGVRLWLFHGPDDGGARELAATLERALGRERLDMDARALASEPGRLADEAAAVSMFGPGPCVRVTGAGDGLTEAAGLLLDATGADNPAILIAGGLAATSKLRKLAEAHPRARALAVYPPGPADFARLARDLARSAGLDPEPGAVALLVAATGGERGLLAREIDKLAVYLDAAPGRMRRLSVEDWHAVGAGAGGAAIDPLLDALGLRQADAVAFALRALATDGQRGIGLLRPVARRFAQLAEARAAVDGGASPDAAAGALRPPLFWKAKAAFTDALGRWRSGELARANAALLATERAIKSPGSLGEPLADACLLGLVR